MSMDKDELFAVLRSDFWLAFAKELQLIRETAIQDMLVLDFKKDSARFDAIELQQRIATIHSIGDVLQSMKEKAIGEDSAAKGGYK